LPTRQTCTRKNEDPVGALPPAIAPKVAMTRILVGALHLAAYLLLLPLTAASAQNAAVPKSVGVLALSRADSIDAMFDALRGFGWVDGKTIQIVFPEASPDPAKLEANMQELLTAKVDIVVAQTKLAIQIAARATTTVPVVMGAFDGDPVAAGLVQSVQHPGANITGSYYNVMATGRERVALLGELLPGMARIGIVMNPASTPSMTLADDMAVASRERGFQVTLIPVRGGNDVDRAFAAAKEQGVDGITTVAGAEIFAIRREIVAAQDKYRIPAVTSSVGYAEMGGLAKLNPDIPLLWRKMAPTIDRLLRGSAKASDLPLITIDSSELEINLRTAQTLGVTVPEDVKRRAVRLFQ
jgi:putative ABC transport system substrate-binding protein